MSEVAEHIQKGDVIDYELTADAAYHDVVAITNKIGIVQEAGSSGDTVPLAITGVWELPAATSLAIAVGDAVYWNADDSNITETATDVPAGIAVSVKASAGTTVQVKID